MNYKKEYNNVLMRAEEAVQKGCLDRNTFDAIFSQLTESEDERIRKWLIKEMHHLHDSAIKLMCQEDIDKTEAALAWLEKQKDFDKMIVVTPEVWDNAINEAFENGKKEGEKQKEQKHPDGCFTCDEYKKGYEAGRLNGLTAGYNKAMKEQKPAEWSEEDELMFLTVIQTLEMLGGRGTTGMQIDWLKSLLMRCPKKSDNWKPSKEQIGALNYAYCELFKREDVGHNILGQLQKLLDDLKKL